MPSRIIKESIATSESLSEISAEAERLFWRLVVKADDFGLYYAHPRILASMCFPLSPPRDQKVMSWLSELTRTGMVCTYTADDGKQYLKIMAWDKCQQQRAKKSKFPQPIEFDINCNQMQSNCNQLIGYQLQSNAYQLQSNVPVNENENVNENVFEKRKRETRTKTSPNGAVGDRVTDGFLRFWDCYPRKVGKPEARKAWEQLSPDDDLMAEILEGVRRWKDSAQWQKESGLFIPYPATFLRGRRWEEEDRAELSAAKRERDYTDDEDFFGGMAHVAESTDPICPTEPE